MDSGGDKETYRRFTDGDKEIIEMEVANGLGYRRIVSKYVTKMKNGKKQWTLGGVKKLEEKIKARGDASRKSGSGRPRTALTNTVLGKIKEHISQNPNTSRSSHKMIRTKFRLSMGVACRARKELDFKALREVKETKMSGEKRESE